MDVGLISALASVVMTLVWIVYLHLVLLQYRRTKRPYMVIHYARDNDPGALCLFVNMSKEPVHIQCVIAQIRYRERVESRFVTESERVNPEEDDVRTKLRQGPVEPGGYLVLGTFDDLIRVQTQEAAFPLGDGMCLEVCVAALHGPSRHHVGARRRFELKQAVGGEYTIHAQSVQTEQLVSRRKRKTVRSWIEKRLQARQPDTATQL